MGDCSDRSKLLRAGAVGFGAGVAVGLLVAQRGRLKDRLPRPSQCPKQGVVFTGSLPPCREPGVWVFFGNHFVNLSYYNSVIAGKDNEAQHKHICYPVRMHAQAGFMRMWGVQGDQNIGDQTITCVVSCRAERAHEMVGILIPFASRDDIFGAQWSALASVPFSCFSWLGAMEPPKGVDEILVFTLRDEQLGGVQHADTGSALSPPTLERPILQTHVDIIVEGALKHGEGFAAEWLNSIQWWVGDDGAGFLLNDREQGRRRRGGPAAKIDSLLEDHPVCCGSQSILRQRAYESGLFLYSHELAENDRTSHKPRTRRTTFTMPPREMTPKSRLAVRCPARNFLVGFGSIIQTASRSSSDPNARDAAPCRIKAEFGYVREWNFQSSTAKICALGLRRVQPCEAGATINGVIFPAPDDMTAFDRREAGYQRVEVPREHVEVLSWHSLPAGARVYVYVPYATAIVAKYGTDPATGLTRCSGPFPPPGLLPCEASGLGLVSPSPDYPILQTYVDVCVTGCLEHGVEFAKEFLLTTFLWSPYWLNERELARRPWLRQKSYVQIDALLEECVPAHFSERKLESEYAVLLRQP